MKKTQIILNTRKSSLKSLDLKLRQINPEGKRRFFILTDENVLEHCLPTLIYNVSELESADFLELPVGEACKGLAIIHEVWGSLLESGADRDAVIVNLGGGCVCDAGGFIAATYKRGIDFVNIPTSLTAMVDAAIGGKTAINFDNSKNQIGAFYNPLFTCVEPAFLQTLPQKELRSGEYEIMKTLLLTGSHLESAFSDPSFSYIGCIQECIDFKLSVVASDPLDKGLRKILNFGHTFGHALEAYNLSHKVESSHGECVAVGMLYALYLSTKKVGLDTSLYRQYKSWLSNRMAVPRLSLKDIEELLGYMRHDKKHHDGEHLCVLLQEPGVPMIDVPVSDNEVRDAVLSA